MDRPVTRLRPAIPEPTCDNPHAQLDWLRDQLLKKYDNEDTRQFVYKSFEAYKRFLREENGYDERLLNDPRYYISVHCDPFVLYNAERYWRSCGYASHTIHGHLKNLNRAVRHASALGLTPADFFIIPELRRPRRETMQRAAYSDEELEFIRRVITPKILHAQKVVAGYTPKGCGSDPRIGHGGSNRAKGSKDAAAPEPTIGWRPWNNMIWYFENVMHCRPSSTSNTTRNPHSRFFYAARKYHGGIDAVWQRLGVSPRIDLNLVVPLAIKLAWETGLNADSITDLRRDAFKEAHPLTGLPYLRYYKERSTGEKELHVSLLDDPESHLHFLSRQSEIIRRTFKLILNLTEPLVHLARDEDKNYLFLVKLSAKGHRSKREIDNVCRLNSRTRSKWANTLIKNAAAKGEAGIPRHINLARFRPTKIASMVREGKDFFAIQAVAGHSRMSTTANYLESLHLNEQERREISAALDVIHRNKEEYEKTPKPYSTSANRSESGSTIFKGIMCDCKNVFDPPQSVRRLPVYKEGTPCTYWNMCLTCPNVIITRKKLPILVGYYREITVAVEGNNLTSVPNGQHYRTTVAVLEGIFNEFDDEDIAWATEISQCVDDYVDPVTYRGVSHE